MTEEINGHIFYSTPEFDQAAERFQNKMDRFLLFGKYDIWKKRQLLNEDNRKWAYITVGHTQKVAWVDNKTMKAYKADGYEKTWMEIKRFKFDRFLRSMDL